VGTALAAATGIIQTAEGTALAAATGIIQTAEGTALAAVTGIIQTAEGTALAVATGIIQTAAWQARWRSTKRTTRTNCHTYTMLPPDDGQLASPKHVEV
jgi:predicted phage tail protein